MDLVNITYKYVNRFINSEKLLELLNNMDRKPFTDTEKKEIDELIKKLKEIITSVPNEIDDIEKKRMASLEKIITNIEKTLKNNKLDEKGQKFLQERYDSLLENKKIIRDGGKRFKSIFSLLTNSETYINYCRKMDEEGLLNFITQYIRVPNPPMINQETFNDLVNVAIKEDKREALWRLAANYDGHNKDLSLIEDYFIEKRDAYYLTELVSVADESLDKEQLIEKVGETHDLKFFQELVREYGYLKDNFNEEQKKKINEIIRKEEENETI